MSRPIVSERLRVAICALAGVAVLVVAWTLMMWELAILLGWATTAALLLISIWTEIAGLDAAETKRVATREDDSRAAAGTVIVVASLVSLVAVMLGLHRANSADDALRAALTTAALGAVALSWLTVHTFFTLRYAHLFYGVDEEGGIDFPGTDAPKYSDFAYVAFTIGMTFQVSDTGINSVRLRRTVLRHAMLSYLFGTAIIASTISVLSGFVA